MSDDKLLPRLVGEDPSDWLKRTVPDPGPEWTVDDPDPLCRLAARLACCTKPYPPTSLLYSDRPWAEIVRENFPDGSVLPVTPEGWLEEWDRQVREQREAEERDRGQHG